MSFLKYKNKMPDKSSDIIWKNVSDTPEAVFNPNDRMIPEGTIFPDGNDLLMNNKKDKQVALKKEDRRVRLKTKSVEAWNTIFGDSEIVAPLHPVNGKTNGLIFPYTPMINFSYNAMWSPSQMVHTNYQVESYSGSEVTSITVSGDFTAQTAEEARYTVAAIHFLRTVTKMFYGQKEGNLAGTPPPSLLFSGHGSLMFNEIPVIVKSLVHDLTPDTDYVEVVYRTGNIWIPTNLRIIVTLGIQPNLIKVRKDFSLKEYASGSLINKGGYI